MNNQVINVNHIYEQKQTWRSRWNCTLQCQSIIRICKMWEEGCVYMRQSFIMNKLRFRWKWHVAYAVIGLSANKYTSHNQRREKRFQPYKGINAQKTFWKTVSSLCPGFWLSEQNRVVLGWNVAAGLAVLYFL